MMPLELPGLGPIRARFLDLLVERLTPIVAAEDACRPGASPDNHALREAQFMLHKIAGSAGSLGFTALGDSARNCEESIIAHLDHGTVSDRDLHAMLTEFQTIAAAAVKAAHESGPG